MIKSGSIYEGWEEYYYEWSSGWGYAVRYITSTNGITWTVVTEPAHIGTESESVIKEGSTYRMWSMPNGDNNYTGSRLMRSRVSTNGGSGWGNWQTGGTLVKLDGQDLYSLSRVRRQPDGTYQLFYWLGGEGIHLASSTDGISFTTQITNLVNLAKVLPITDDISHFLVDFGVFNIAGEDWFYINYCTKLVPPFNRCISSHMAVARPIHRSELSLSKSVSPAIVRPGNSITYTLIFSNAGPAIATGVRITDILPSALTNPVVNSNLAITNTGYSPNYVWQVQNLSPGAVGVITITAKVKSNLSTNSFTNTATIVSMAVETDTTNNKATANNLITAGASPIVYTYLPTILSKSSSDTFPVHIGDAIPVRPVNPQGETFFSRAIQIPASLPSTGHFYFSTQPNGITEVLVDDEIVILSNGVKVFSYDFSTNGHVEAAILAMPRAILEQLAGKTVTVKYVDIYGRVVKASDMWLIWIP